MRSFALIALFFQFFIPAISQHVNFRDFSQELPQSYVYSIVQDEHGFLWVGTENGLTRYDGKNFKSYTVNDSLGDNFITCSLVSKGIIWFGHMNGRISVYNGRIFSSPVSLAQNSWITDIEQNPQGEIWAASFSNGFKLLNGKPEMPFRKSTSQIPVYCFKFLDNNELLIGSVDGLLHCRLQSGELKLINKIPGIPQTKVPDIEKMRNGSGFYIATENEGIFKLLVDGKNFSVVSLFSEKNAEFSGVQDIFEDSQSNIWVSSSIQGLKRFSKQESNAVVYNKAVGYSTNSVKTIFEDREGNIWAGNYGTGLTQITENRFSLDSYDKKYGSSVNSIQISEKVKWLATDKGILKINEKTGELIRFYSNNYSFPATRVTSLFLSKNDLWAGTETGLYHLSIDKERFTRYKISDGDLENSITCITGRNNEIWVGTKKGACQIDRASDIIRWYTHSQGGLPHNSVNHILIDTQGKVWVLTQSNTLAVIENGKVGKKIIFSEKRINSLGPILQVNSSAYWIGSQGSGVFQIKEDTLINLTTREGLLSDYCYSMILDRDGNLWVGHRGGLSKIRPGDFYIKPVREYDGIKNSCEFNKNAVFKDENNRIYFGTNEGVWTYDANLEKKHAVLPPVLTITSIKINDKEISERQNLVLQPGNYKIEFGFIGVNLKEPDLVTYTYQLTGYDLSRVGTSSTNVIYPHLTEGDYTFRLWASSGDGVISKQPLTINIHVRTPLWKHWWFYILVVIIFQFLFIVYNKKKELKHIQEKRILEAKVQERTFELAQKNTLLEEKQQEIISQNKELERYQNYLEDLVKARTIELINAKEKAEESNRLKTAILNNLSHEIRTPMNAICGFSKLLDDDLLKPRERKEYIKIINHNSESLLTLISEMLDISLIESNQLTIINEKIDLYQLLTDLENQFKTNNNKNIELEFINKFQKEKPVIICDTTRLRQVFANLLSNAFKFTDSGSIKFGYEFLNHKVKFFVSDTGIGIAKEDTEKIFDLFHKVENNPKKFYRGAGVGLTTNKKLIGLMGGEIWVESVVNEGSTFYFTIPVKDQACY